MKKINKLKIVWILMLCGAILGCFTQPKLARAELLNTWDDDRAYRPTPILFLHGFGEGSPTATWTEDEDHHPNIDLILQPFFDEYYPDPDVPTILDDTRYPYLEVKSFIDKENLGNLRQELIDRNSSIDTYQAGDYYVSTGERNIGDQGWSDKVDDLVLPVLNAYDTEKLSLVDTDIQINTD